MKNQVLIPFLSMIMLNKIDQQLRKRNRRHETYD